MKAALDEANELGEDYLNQLIRRWGLPHSMEYTSSAAFVREHLPKIKTGIPETVAHHIALQATIFTLGTGKNARFWAEA